MDNPEEITVLSLCAGYGGLELGLARALANPPRVVAVEIEAYALANLVAKAEEGSLAVEALWPDLRTFPAERFRGCFDFVLAGYPCQGESVAGKRLGTEDPRWLWSHIARIVQAVEPVWCFFENVPGHLSLGFPAVYRSLRDMGYKVEAGLFTAAECGAPHKRQRLFILAHSEHPEPRLQIRQGPQAEFRGHRLAIGGELADARLCFRCAEQGKQQEECSEEFQGSTELADAGGEFGEKQCQNRKYAHSAAKQQSKRESVCREKYARDASPSLAHTSSTEHEGRQDQPRNNKEEIQAIAGSCDLWPARPGQPQYEWEEPRVVEYPRQYNQRKKCGVQDNMCGSGISTQTGGQAQSRVGSSVDGPSTRVDQLRLLGNGVVPQQAEKAFRDLSNR